MDKAEQRIVLESFLVRKNVEFGATARLSHLGRKFREHFPDLTKFHPYPKIWSAKPIAELAERVASGAMEHLVPKQDRSHFSIKKKTELTPTQLFLKSSMWKRLRYDRLVIDQFKCLACGASRATGATLHVDHIKPISKFWHLRCDTGNLQTLCSDCNKGKSNVHFNDLRRMQSRERRVGRN